MTSVDLEVFKKFEKGDYVKVAWFDASDAKATLEVHKKPECLVDEWGIFLGVEGTPKHLVLGKHYVRKHMTWEATRIPASLIVGVELIAKRASPVVYLRKYKVQSSRQRLWRVKDEVE